MNILAKPNLSLQHHLLDVDESGKALFNVGFFDGMIDVLGLDRDEFYRYLRVCCLLHDLGKANEDFQKMITNPNCDFRQRIRHEHISSYLITTIPDWFDTALVPLQSKIIATVILGHHIKSPPPGGSNYHKTFGSYDVDQNNNSVKLSVNDSSLHIIFRDKIAKILKRDFVPELQNIIYLDQKTFKNSINLYNLFSKNKPEEIILTSALKISLVCADSLGSFLPGCFKNKQQLLKFIDYNIRKNKITPAEVQLEVINPFLLDNNIKAFNDIQKDISIFSENQNPNRTIIMSSCGSGKTLSAYIWLKKIAETNNIYHSIFCYPTKATATEGYKRYLFPTENSILLHSSSCFELEQLVLDEDMIRGRLSIGDKSNNINDYLIQQISADTMEKWGGKWFSSTVDQFGFMEFIRGAILKAPLFFKSALIYDEVHSYDGKMLDSLFDIIDLDKEKKIPILIMTATLPDNLKREFEKRDFVFKPNDGIEQINFEANYPRYNIERVKSSKDAIEVAIKEYNNGNKVLFVCNKVSPSKSDEDNGLNESCQGIYSVLKNSGYNVVCYHSRFIEKDRIAAHTKVMNAFKSKSPIIAVTTQVCEMSLDIDADVLITANAPPCSLIQRLGRCCRNRRKYNTDDRFSRVVVFNTAKSLPYDSTEIIDGIKLISKCTGKGISQKKLTETLFEISRSYSNRTRSHFNRFLSETTWITYPESFREENDITRQAILIEHKDEIISLLKNKQRINHYIINVPVWYCGFEMGGKYHNKLEHFRVFKDHNYSSDIGFAI